MSEDGVYLGMKATTRDIIVGDSQHVAGKHSQVERE